MSSKDEVLLSLSSLGSEEDLSTKNKDLGHEVSNLKDVLQTKDQEIKKLSLRVSDLTISLDHEKELNENKEKLLKFYKDQNESQNNQNLATELSTLREQHSICQKEKEKFETEINQLKEEIEEHKVNSEKLLNTLTDKQIETEELEEKIKILNDKINKGNFADKDKGSTNNSDEKNENENYVGENESYEHEHLNTEETKMMKEMYQDLQTEFDEYKKKSEEKLNCLLDEISNHELTEQRNTELEAMNKKMQIEIGDLKKYIEDMDNKNQGDQKYDDLIAEINNLNSTINSLQRNKEQILTNTKEEKEFYINERKEIEDMYGKVLEQKTNLENNYNEYKRTVTQKFDDKDAELNCKVLEITHLNSIIEKITKEKNELETANSRLTNLDKKYVSMISESKKKYEEEKGILQHKIKELQTKYDFEHENLLQKLNTLTEKNEQLTAENKSLLKYKSLKRNSISLLGTMLGEEGGKPAEGQEDADVEALKGTIEAQKKEIEELKLKVNDNLVKRLEAEKEFLDNNLKTLQKQMDAFKEQKEKDKKFYEEELKAAILSKMELATSIYEKDDEIIYWKNQLKKLKSKLEKMGIIKMKS